MDLGYVEVTKGAAKWKFARSRLAPDELAAIKEAAIETDRRQELVGDPTSAATQQGIAAVRQLISSSEGQLFASITTALTSTGSSSGSSLSRDLAMLGVASLGTGVSSSSTRAFALSVPEVEMTPQQRDAYEALVAARKAIVGSSGSITSVATNGILRDIAVKRPRTLVKSGTSTRTMAGQIGTMRRDMPQSC